MRIEHAARVRPAAGQLRGGDASVVRSVGRTVVGVVIDVLGHGELAAGTASQVMASLERELPTEPREVLARLNREFRGSRGLAAAAVSVDSETGVARFSGVGNVVGRVIGHEHVRLVSQDGIVGQFARDVRQQELALEPGSIVVLHTDGVSERFGVREYPTIHHHGPAEIATSLIEWFGRKHDDCGCLVMRLHEEDP